MKTHTIKTPTAELMIVELPRLCDYHASSRKLWVKDTQSGEELTVKGSWDVLGKPDEIREEDAKELVDRIGEGDPCYQGDWFVNYQDDEYMFETAKESLLSLIESEIYWENPYKIPSSDDINWYRNQINGDFSERYTRVFDWNEAELRTFDRNRTIIFKKN